MDFEIFKQLGVAIALSSLIGLERERKNQIYGPSCFAGVRTLTLIGLLGALSFLLSNVSIFFFVTIASGFLGLLIVSYFVMSKKFQLYGASSEIATIIVFIIGILSAMGQFVLATAIALFTLIILHFKNPIHKIAKGLKDKEIVSTIQFIVIAFVVLPLLPNEYYGPYDFFNPYVVWLMVVFISGISYVSYIGIKLLGTKRGIGLTGFFAGLISSTALVLTFSPQSKKNKNIINPYVVAVVIASSAMFFRILLEVAVLNRELMKLLLIPILVMGGVGFLCVLFFWLKKEKLPANSQKDIGTMKSPFSLGPALKFGFLFALILFLVKFGEFHFGEKGLYITSVMSGILDVDAITVSMANLAKTSGISKMSAVYSILIAATTNTLVKGGIFFMFGNRKVALRIISVFVIILASGGISLFFI